MKRLLAATLLLFTAAATAAPFHGSDASEQKYGAGNLPLWDHHRQTRTLAEYRGKVLLLFAGFLNCSSYCPLTLTKYRQALDLLGADGERVQVLYLTLDPERDTPERLKDYLGAFHPSFIGLYTRPDMTLNLAKSLGAYYQKIPGRTPGNYTIDHSVDTLVFDLRGRARLVMPDEMTAQEIVEDVRRLLREESNLEKAFEPQSTRITNINSNT